MKKSIGNPFQEAHGRDMIIYEWIAPIGTDPYSIPDKIAVLLPNVNLTTKAGEQHGFINTSRLDDGSLYVAVALHQTDCLVENCDKGEGKIKIHKAPILSKQDTKVMKQAIGEHPTKKVEGDNDES